VFNRASRGELFLFYSNGDLPILIGLFAGESATITSKIDEKVILQKAMEALKRIFGNNCPVQVGKTSGSTICHLNFIFKPVDYMVTRWHLDRFTRGCYSYMSTSSTGI
jgi:monoamine oxidase